MMWTRLEFAVSIACLSSAAAGQVTELVSVGSREQLANGACFSGHLSADGRFVVFESYANNLADGDTEADDIFVRDRQTGSTILASVPPAGVLFDYNSRAPSISSDGHVVAFVTDHIYLGSIVSSVYVRDLVSDTTTSVASTFADYTMVAISGDGLFVGYTKKSTAAVKQVHVYDRTSGLDVLASTDSTGHPANANCESFALSHDGRFVAFASAATNLVAWDTNGKKDVFVRDMIAGTTELVSVTSSGEQVHGDSDVPTISADGRMIAFQSSAADLIPSDTNGATDVFAHDRSSGETALISSGVMGQGDHDSFTASISADGRFVAFASLASNLVPNDTNALADVFVRDRATGTIFRASVSGSGGEANAVCDGPSISADGARVSFDSAAELDPAYAGSGVFVRDMTPGCPLAATYCTALPNSTGASAALSSTGWGSLSANNLILTCAGLPSTNGRFFWGTVAIDPGIPFGDGVRCVGGALHRLSVVHSVGGVAIQAQDFSSSAYSTAVIGSTGHFEYWYRDPAEGGAGFNASDGLSVVFCD
jgi:Tol biopolymer transport system component